MNGKFNQNAQHDNEQLERAFSGPLGPMLGKMGVLSQEQQDESGLVQAQMIAIRTAIEAGRITAAQATEILGGVQRKPRFWNTSEIIRRG